MITIGIRAEPSGLTFAIYDANGKTVLNVEEIKIPAAFGIPEGLKYIRSNILDVLREYKVTQAGIRVTESNSQRINIERVQLEGVIQEAFASSSVSKYYVGQISSISAKLGIDRKSFKPFASAEEEYPIENWNTHTNNAREAILCAIGAANV